MRIRCWTCLSLIPNGVDCTRLVDKLDPSRERTFCNEACADRAFAVIHAMRMAGNDPFDRRQLRAWAVTVPLAQEGCA